MSQKDPSFKRLKLVLVLTVFVLAFNLCQAVILNNPADYEKSVGYTGTVSTADETTDSDSSFDMWNFIWGFFGFFFGGFLFTIASFPAYMIIILTPIYLIPLIAFWYLIWDFIKDISILGSGI